MLPRLVLLTTILACGAHDKAEEDADATIAFLSPEDGATVAVGDVDFSVLVENFALVDPAKHGGEEEPEGYIGLSVDGVEVLQSGETQFTLTLEEAGERTIEAELFYANDGDPLDEPATATLSLLVE